LAALAVAVAVVAVAVTRYSGDEAEPSFRDLMAEMAGGDITQGELARREEVARFLCGVEGEVLRAVWSRLDARQLRFQDAVFQAKCPERLVEYAEATGRFRIREG
jgi:hypothetical protein